MAVVGIYVGLLLLFNLPQFQAGISRLAQRQLSELLGTNVSIDGAEIRPSGKISFNGLLVLDEQADTLLYIERFHTRLQWVPLVKERRIALSSVQLLGPDINIIKDSSNGRTNLQFILDRLSGKDDDESNESSALNLRINSLLIRRGHISYHEQDAARSASLNLKDLSFDDIRGNISLKALSKDSINASIRQFSFTESRSGMGLDHLEFFLTGNRKEALASRLSIGLNGSNLTMDSLKCHFLDVESYLDAFKGMTFEVGNLSGSINPASQSGFLPLLASVNMPLDLKGSAYGTLDSIVIPAISLKNPYGHATIRGNALTMGLLSGIANTRIDTNLEQLDLDDTALVMLSRLADSSGGLEDMARKIDHIHFSGRAYGPLTALVSKGSLETALGNLSADVTTSRKDDGATDIRGRIATHSLDLGGISGSKDLGSAAFNLAIDASLKEGRRPSVEAKGVVDSITFKNYTYHGIDMDAAYRGGSIIGRMSLDDENIRLDIDGMANTTARTPVYDFRASVDNLNLGALGFSERFQDTELSLRVNADMTGRGLDDLEGTLRIDSLSYQTPSQDYEMSNLLLEARTINDTLRNIGLTTDFMEASLSGRISAETLYDDVLEMLTAYLPSLGKELGFKEQPSRSKARKANVNDFNLIARVDNTDIVSALTGLPLKTYGTSSLSGSFNNTSRKIRLSGYVPRMRYDERYIESASLNILNPGDLLEASIQMTQKGEDSDMTYRASLKAKDDQVQTLLGWDNNLKETYAGELSALVDLMRTPSEEDNAKGDVLETILNIQPTQVIVCDTIWQIAPSKVTWKQSRISVEDFMFSNEDRHTNIYGTVSKDPLDTLKVDLNQMNIQYIFDVADQGVTFQGDATGQAWLVGLMDNPKFSADLFIKNFGAFDGVVGDAIIHGDWINDVQAIDITADITETVGSQDYTTHVDGFIYPLKPTSSLDLMIKAGGTNLQFIQGFLVDITPEFKGRVWGDVNLFGKFKGLNLNGDVMADASLKIDMLGTTYQVQDSIKVRPDGLYFSQNRFSDEQGHTSQMNGWLKWMHFQDISYNFDFGMDNTMIINTQPSVDFPFYGTVYGTGTVHLQGGDGGMNMRIACTTNKNSIFTYIKDGTTTADSNQFITFNDLTPRRKTPQMAPSEFGVQKEEQKEESSGSAMDFRLELMLDVTQDMTMRVIMDQITGDNISAKGTANLRAEYYNKGSFNMFGIYNLNSGTYKMSIQEVIRKDLQIQDGSSVTFNGDPLDGDLELHTLYQVNSASLNDLIPNASSYVDQTSVRVNCLMDITGNLSSPTITMGLELPLERDEVQSLVKNYIPTDDQMQIQILYLLGIGKFYTPDYVNVTQNSNVMSSVVSSTLSGQLNNALSNLINSNNWNIGTNLSTGVKGWTDMEAEAILSGALLNNRLLINGNLGYREDQMRGNTNFVGDFDAQLLLTKNGDIRLKAYNETNDRYYTRTNLTTQGIGIVFRKDFDKWHDLMFWNKWLRKNREKEQDKE